jgi:hypothetical protein
MQDTNRRYITAVAAAMTGFDGVMHIPNGMMLTIGTWSMILASGC